MAGLYIHIPFCKSRCIYCSFYSTTHHELRQRYVDALCREMEMRGQRSEARGERIETIYLGGGTPSQLTISQLEQLFQYINKVYPLTTHHLPLTPEITIEMNPDDVTTAYAEALVRLGINRVSMGAQTFDDQRLCFLHRRHTAAQVPQTVQTLRDAGIRNISIDLMYGFPGETLEQWERDIDCALSLDVEHLSAYCLSIEEGTPLWRLKMKDEKLKMGEERIKMPGEELERTMYELLIDKLTAADYEHYEISNFARPGFRSRHNSSYWHDVPYIGLGAAAHSYSPPQTSPQGRGIRSWNVADIHQYIEALERGELPSGSEQLDEDTHYNDRITTALRTSDGLDLACLSDRHRSYCMKEARRFVDDGLLILQGDHLTLTRKGIFVSDYILSTLMLV